MSGDAPRPWPQESPAEANRTPAPAHLPTTCNHFGTLEIPPGYRVTLCTRCGWTSAPAPAKDGAA